jgi:hypothetical protein
MTEYKEKPMGRGIWIGALIAMGAGAIMACLLVILAIVCSFYILQSIGLYKMAKKLGYDSPWLAWIPFVNLYIMFILPKHSFEPLVIKQEIMNRGNAFWIYMGVTFGTNIVINIFSAMSEIPVIGILCSLMSVILSLGMIFSMIIFQYPLYRDLLELFFTKETASICAIVGMLFPMALSVILFIAGKRDVQMPDSVERIYYLEKNEEQK